LVFNHSQIAGRTIKVIYGVKAVFAPIPMTLINSTEKSLWALPILITTGCQTYFFNQIAVSIAYLRLRYNFKKSPGRLENLDYYQTSGIFVDLNHDGFLDMFGGEADERGLLARLGRARLFK
jgi:hypothetical protein